jgi:hypothetical protein
MRFYFLSNSDNGGGIAFNVAKLNKEISTLGFKSTAVYLNRTNVKAFYKAVFDEKNIVIYCTSIQTLYWACLLTLCRWFLLKKTKIAQIIYHPRFIDPTISVFRSLLNKLIRKIPLSNIYYYSDECVISSKLEIYSNVNDDRIIGLASVYEDITSKEVDLPYLNSSKLIISTVGRFVDFKIGYLLAIINYVKTKKDLVLYVVGYGPKEDLIKNAAGGADNIFLLGRLGIESTKYVVENSDLYVGMGTTLVDAVSVGTPAIVAIESSSQAITTGYFGMSGGISFGEFNEGVKYSSLIEFLDNAILNKNNHYYQQSKPWLKLISSHEKLSKVNIVYVLVIVILIPVVSLVRKFEEKDYH